jgi:hypothetical protein
MRIQIKQPHINLVATTIAWYKKILEYMCSDLKPGAH